MSSCLVTEKVQVPEEVNFPPSVVSAPDAFELGTSLDQIVTFDLATDGPQLELPIIVRDPNVDQELVYEVWVDFTGTNLGARIQEATPISAMGVLERSLTVRIPATELAPSEGAAQRS
ncbi:MAG TPA: hypothetical protein RMG45_30820, partial [Polyangiaceae bacterium LLY-WYZ-15_(1-7)]|nr:hypothetical protein [Polyangiaceae bacterium LLY-WYZ-15_(1-7)]